MSKEFLGRGWKSPVDVDAKRLMAVSEYEEDIKEAILIILKTAKGERVMRPDFGCGIHDYIFSVVNTATIALMQNSVEEALKLWEPRIELVSVDIGIDEIDLGQVIIDIKYKVRTTNNQYSLVYPFFITEGT